MNARPDNPTTPSGKSAAESTPAGNGGAESFEQTIQEGIRALDRREFAAAATLFKRVLSEAPFRADVKELLALALDERSFKEDELHAERFGKQAKNKTTASTPLEGIRHHERRNALHRWGKYVMAGAVVAVAGLGVLGFFQLRTPAPAPKATLESDEVLALVENANNYARDGRYEEAIDKLKDAERSQPNDPASIRALQAKYRYSQGEQLWMKGEQDKAIGSLAQAVELAPDDADYHQAYGSRLHQKGFGMRADKPAEAQRYEKRAIAELEKALELDAGHASALFSLYRAYVAVGDETRGFDAARKLIKLDPDGMQARQAREDLEKRKVPIQ